MLYHWAETYPETGGIHPHPEKFYLTVHIIVNLPKCKMIYLIKFFIYLLFIYYHYYYIFMYLKIYLPIYIFFIQIASILFFFSKIFFVSIQNKIFEYVTTLGAADNQKLNYITY